MWPEAAWALTLNQQLFMDHKLLLDMWRPLCVRCVMASMPLHPSADRTRFNVECHVSAVTSYICCPWCHPFVQPCNQKKDIWSFRPKVARQSPWTGLNPGSCRFRASTKTPVVSLSVTSLFDGWGVINSLCVCSCRKAVVQKREGGLQPAAQTGNQTGTARQARRPGELKRN